MTLESDKKEWSVQANFIDGTKTLAVENTTGERTGYRMTAIVSQSWVVSQPSTI